MDAVAKSIISQPALAISRADAREQELVACVWKWIGMSVTERIASTSTDAARGFSRPAMSYSTVSSQETRKDRNSIQPHADVPTTRKN